MTAVDLWVLALDRVEGHRLLDSPDLSAVERSRRDSLHRADDRRRFVGGALLIRAIGAAALGIPAADVEVDRRCPTCRRPHGRPVLRPAGADGLPHVSVSHAGPMIAVAACAEAPVGVDIEPAEAGRDLTGTDHLILSPAEKASGPADPDDLLRYWVRKEAVLKAAGIGLMVPLEHLTVSGPDEPAAVRQHDLDVTAPISLADVHWPTPATGALPAGSADITDADITDADIIATAGMVAAVAVLAGTTPEVTVRDGTSLLATHVGAAGRG